MLEEPRRIIITGKPGSGKTFVVQKTINRLKELGIDVSGVITPDIRDKTGKRKGFEVIGVKTGLRKILATKNGSKYKVFTENFLSVLESEMKEVKDVFVVDEIGPMELGYSDNLDRKWLKDLLKLKTVVFTVKKTISDRFLKFAGGNAFFIDIDVDKKLSYTKILEIITGTEAFLFDLDGVIIDSSEFHKKAWITFMNQKGVKFTEEDFVKTFGKTNEDILRQYFPDLPPEDIRKMSFEKEEIYRSLAKGNIKPIDGVLDVLEIIKKKDIKLALVSSTPKENIDFIFRELDIGRFFDVVVSGTDITKGKPDPECYLIAVERLQVRPYRCWVVEDSEHGILAGRNAGTKCMGILTTHKHLEHSDINFENFMEMKDFTLSVILRN